MTILKFLYNYYYVFLLPFLSISVFYAMEYLTRGLEFFVNDSGVRWKFLAVTATIQFFVSVVITWSVIAVFETDSLSEYKTFQMVATILLGATPFNISILVWVAIKLEIYKLMKSRYKDDFSDAELLDLIHHKKIKKETENKKETEKETQENETLPFDYLDSKKE